MSSKKIFVNVAVENLERSLAFFKQLGYEFNPQFTNDQAGCMVVSEDIFVMLLGRPFFQSFVPNRTVVDAKTSTEALLCLSADSRKAVDALVERALAAGARELREPQDHGFMYGRAFEDLDGHVWEHVWMDPAHVQK